jgi:hypothetical protein
MDVLGRLMVQAERSNQHFGGGYEDNSNMKTFMGTAPSITYAALAEALEHEARHGPRPSLGRQEVAALRDLIGLQMGTCAVQCTPAFWQCVDEVPGAQLSEKFQLPAGKACLAQSFTCNNSCLKSNQGP